MENVNLVTPHALLVLPVTKTPVLNVENQDSNTLTTMNAPTPVTQDIMEMTAITSVATVTQSTLNVQDVHRRPITAHHALVTLIIHGISCIRISVFNSVQLPLRFIIQLPGNVLIVIQTVKNVLGI